MSSITEEKMCNALLFLADTDEFYAIAKADMLRAELVCKRTRARLFLTGEGSVESRKASAEASGEANAADDAYIDALTKFETLKAKRDRAEIVIDVWRSVEASRRRA
jgi:hypothetical protein